MRRLKKNGSLSLLHARIAKQHPDGTDELEAAAYAAWVSITQTEIDAICGKFAKKLKEVAGKNGAG